MACPGSAVGCPRLALAPLLLPQLSLPRNPPASAPAASALRAGIPGIILPAACTIAMFHNITTAFAMPADKAAVSPTLARAVNIMSLTFQWLTVPMFVIAMQLPQGVCACMRALCLGGRGGWGIGVDGWGVFLKH